MDSKDFNYRKYKYLANIPTGSASDVITEGCVVLEGGAFRGLYTQGVLDFLMQNDINMKCAVGVSAGAMSGLSYIAGHIGRSARLNLGFRHDPDYVGIGAMAKSGSPIRLEFALHDYDKLEPIDLLRLYSDHRRFVAVAANLNTGKAAYLEKTNCTDMFAAVKASASMPFVSPIVYVDGTPYLDGGSCCKIPYLWAMREGYEKIVVIRTRDRAFRKPDKVSSAARIRYRRYPAFAKQLDNSNIHYNKQCDELLELEQSGRIFTIAPSVPVTVSRLESDMEKLGQLYWLGYNDAANNLAALQKYLDMNP